MAKDTNKIPNRGIETNGGTKIISRGLSFEAIMATLKNIRGDNKDMTLQEAAEEINRRQNQGGSESKG